jgi:hypothetical protein
MADRKGRTSGFNSNMPWTGAWKSCGGHRHLALPLPNAVIDHWPLVLALDKRLTDQLPNTPLWPPILLVALKHACLASIMILSTPLRLHHRNVLSQKIWLADFLRTFVDMALVSRRRGGLMI